MGDKGVHLLSHNLFFGTVHKLQSMRHTINKGSKQSAPVSNKKLIKNFANFKFYTKPKNSSHQVIFSSRILESFLTGIMRSYSKLHVTWCSKVYFQAACHTKNIFTRRVALEFVLYT